MLSTDRVVHELYRRSTRSATRSSSGSARRWRRTASSTARSWPGGRSRRRRTARGSRACCGRGSARGWPPGARRLERAAAGPGAAVVEVPLLFESGMERRVRRDDRGRRRRARCAPSGPAARGHEALDERAHVSFRSRKRRNVRRMWSLTTARSRSLEAKLSAVLEMLRTMSPTTVGVASRRDSARRGCRGAPASRRPPPAPRWSRWSCSVAVARRGGAADAAVPKAVNELTLPLDYADVIRAAGGREAPRPGADRGRDLRRDEVRPADLRRRRARADADHARRPPSSWRTARAPPTSPSPTSPRRRSTSPTAATTCATCSTSTTAAPTLALAAYNGGESNVDRWVADARAGGHTLTVDDIPFPETRAYVGRVLSAEGKYRHKYAQQLYG